MNGQTTKRLKKVARIKYIKGQLTDNEKEKIPWYEKLIDEFGKILVWDDAPEPIRNEKFNKYFERVKKKWKNTPWNERNIKELKEGMKK